MTAARQIPLLSPEEYLADELRSKTKREYTGGYVYAMAGGTRAHNRISVAFTTAMSNALRGRRCEALNSDTKVRVRMPTHTRFYYPDGIVVCEPNQASDTFEDRPVVIAEVISASTRRIDEGEKRDAYLTIPELAAYLLIESTSRRVVVYQRTSAGFVASQYEGPGAIVPLDDIKATLSLDDLYERVDFAAAIAEESEHDADEMPR